MPRYARGAGPGPLGRDRWAGTARPGPLGRDRWAGTAGPGPLGRDRRALTAGPGPPGRDRRAGTAGPGSPGRDCLAGTAGPGPLGTGRDRLAGTAGIDGIDVAREAHFLGYLFIDPHQIWCGFSSTLYPKLLFHEVLSQRTSTIKRHFTDMFLGGGGKLRKSLPFYLRNTGLSKICESCSCS